MTDLQEELIAVYAKGSVDEVHASPEYAKFYDTNKGKPGFAAERGLVEEMRSRVDATLSAGQNVRDLVATALSIIWNLRKDKERNVYRELILEAMAPVWETKQRDYFKEKSLTLIAAREYFLSFTSRNLGYPNQNVINANHREFIKEAIGSNRYESADLGKENLLAAAIDHLLRSNRRLDGFFFPKHLGDNKLVEKKLLENCEQALSFVQLIQEEIFRFTDPVRNWCFFEFNAVSGSNKPLIFVQVEEKIDGADLYVDYGKWFTAFSARDPIKLVDTRWADRKPIESNLASIRDLGDQILQSLHAIYASVPD
ncbi:MAG TPA: hypothetical protein VNP98_15695 [Chthoniobacterales bacterium]|nr:hypothetical protein [Chthoniobacterales bacterium]